MKRHKSIRRLHHAPTVDTCQAPKRNSGDDRKPLWQKRYIASRGRVKYIYSPAERGGPLFWGGPEAQHKKWGTPSEWWRGRPVRDWPSTV